MVSNPFADGIDVQVSADTGEFRSGLAGAISRLADFRTEIALAGGALAALSAAGIKKSITAFADFDEAMTESLAIMGDVDAQMRSTMEDTAREVAQATTFSAEEAAESYFFLASAGLDAAESVEALPEVSQFAQAGMFDMAQATDILTDAASALGLEMSELGDLSDTLVKANTLANASVEQFGEALTNKAAPAMKRMGIETEEGVSALSVFADQGLKGRRAGSILARTLEGLERQARNNAEEFEELGIRVFDADGEMRSMEDIIADMEGSLGDMSTEQRNAALEQLGFNQQAMQGIDLLMGNSEQMREYRGELEEAGGTTEEVANNQLQTFNRQLDLFKSQIQDIFISIGTLFIPVLTTLMSHLTDAVSLFQEFNERTNGMAGAITLVAGLVGGLAMVLGSLISVFGGLPSIIGVTTTGLGAMKGALLALTGPIGLVIAAVALLTAAFVTDFAGIRTATMKVIDVIRTQFLPIFTTAQSLISDILSSLKRAFSGFSLGAEGDIRGLVNVIQALLIDRIVDISNRLQARLLQMQMWWRAHGDEVAMTVRRFVDSVISAIQTGLEFIQSVVSVALDVVAHIWTEHGDTIMNSVQWLSDRLRTIVSALMGFVVSAFELFRDRVLPLIVNVTTRIMELWEEHRDTVVTLLTTFVDIVFDVLEGLWELAVLVYNIFQRVKEVISDVLNVIWTNVIKPFVDVLMSFWREHGDEITTETTETWNAIQEKITKVTDFIRELIGVFTDIFRAIWDRWGDDIIDTARFVFDIIEAVITTFVDWATTFWEIFGDEILTIFEYTLDAILTVAKIVLDLLRNTFLIVTGIIQGDWEQVWDAVTAIFTDTLDHILDFAGKWGGRFLDWLGDLVDDVIGWFTDLARDLVGSSIVPDMFSDILSTAKDFGSDALGWLGDFVSDFVSDVKDWASDIVGKVDDMASDILKKLDISSRARSAGRSIGSSLASGIKSKISSVKSAAGRLASAARSRLPGSDADKGPLSDLSSSVEVIPNMLTDALTGNQRDVARAADKLAGAVDLSPNGPGSNVGAGQKVINMDIDVHANDRQGGKEAADAFKKELRSSNI